MNEIIVIRVKDPDGSLFQTIVDALKDKRAEIIHVTAPSSSVPRIGELEIHHERHRVFVGGREVRLNHGELHGQRPRAGAQLYAAGLRRGVSVCDHIGGKYHLAAEKEVGGGS